jgi:hypothetical protein
VVFSYHQLHSFYTMGDEENLAKSSLSSTAAYDRLALTDAVDWVDDDERDNHDGDDTFGTGDEPGGLWRDPHAEHESAAGSLQSRDTTAAAPGGATTSTRSSRFMNGIWNTCLMSDDRCSICGIALLDGSPAIKLVKFVCVTFAAICLMHQFLRIVVS